jgi:hypothetical protein
MSSRAWSKLESVPILSSKTSWKKEASANQDVQGEESD